MFSLGRYERWGAGSQQQSCLFMIFYVQSPGELISISLRNKPIPLGAAATVFAWKTANKILHKKELATTDLQLFHLKTINLISS